MYRKRESKRILAKRSPWQNFVVFKRRLSPGVNNIKISHPLLNIVLKKYVGLIRSLSAVKFQFGYIKIYLISTGLSSDG
jgi:hypothetical protein